MKLFGIQLTFLTTIFVAYFSHAYGQKFEEIPMDAIMMRLLQNPKTVQQPSFALTPAQKPVSRINMNDPLSAMLSMYDTVFGANGPCDLFTKDGLACNVDIKQTYDYLAPNDVKSLLGDLVNPIPPHINDLLETDISCSLNLQNGVACNGLSDVMRKSMDRDVIVDLLKIVIQLILRSI